MKYRSCYSVWFKTPVHGLVNDLRLSIREGEFHLQGVDDEGRNGKATITIPIDPKGLSVRVGRTPLDGGPPQRGIEVPEADEVGGILRSAVWVLSFVLEVPIETASLLQDRALITESKTDEERLQELESLDPFVGVDVSLAIRVPRFKSIDAATLEKLLSREVGLALYSDALRLSTPIGQFREFWRMLESAFGQKDSALLASLASYPPAICLEFDTKELRDLHALRGRASHAESSAALKEYHIVSERVEGLLPRFKSLAEEVLLTKKSWGTKGLTVERLAPLRTYVNKDGISILFQDNSE